MANHALDLNPPNAQIHISTHGSDWLWAAFSLMAFVLLIVLALSFIQPRGSRTFHQLAIIVLTTASLAYFSMASDLGATGVKTEFRGDGETRQIWYVRYIQWFITFPTLVLSVLLTTGLSLSDVVTAVFMCMVVVVTALVGSLVESTYKWGFFTFGCTAIFYVWYALLVQGPRSTFPGNGAFRIGYWSSAAYLSFMLITYPICWGLSEGSNDITPTSEMIWYGILDCITGPIFILFFLFQLRAVDYAAFELESGKFTDHAGHVTTRPSKAAEAGLPEPVTAPTS